MDEDLSAEMVRLLPFRRGHFGLESGHHGDAWLDLELLCLRPGPIRRLAVALAARLGKHQIEAVSGPLVEGAFIALMVAEELDVPFTYSEGLARDGAGGLFPFRYQLPPALRRSVTGRRVAIVNDVINAGSAVRGTLVDLQALGAHPVAMGTLAVLGGSASRLAAENAVALETLAALPNQIWAPPDCPLCARKIPLSGREPSAE